MIVVSAQQSLVSWLQEHLDALGAQLVPVLLTEIASAQTQELHVAACFVVGEEAMPPLLGAPLVVRVFDALPAGTPPPGQWWLGRGEHERLHLAQALHHVAAVHQLRELDEVAGDPIPHDFRGAIGILQLATQVLRASPAPRGISGKIEAASLKLSTLLEDLALLTQPRSSRGSFPIEPSPVGMRPTSSSDWPQQLAEVDQWFQAAHRGRQLNCAVGDSFPGTHAESAAIVRGLVDAVARLSPAESPVLVGTAEDEPGHHVAVMASVQGDSDLSTRHLGALTRAPLPGIVQRLPFRLRVSLACAERTGGEIDVRLRAGHLQLIYRSEAPPSSGPPASARSSS